jgi:NitT/TauT family transport system permease protein
MNGVASHRGPERRRTMGASSWRRWAMPLAVGLALAAVWEATVWWKNIPPYMLPAPSHVAKTIISHGPELAAEWWITVKTMLVALAAAVVIGVALAALFASSRMVELSLMPYAVILQVTPLVAVAPFIVLWVGFERVWLTQIICAWIVAFFPIVANTALGLKSADGGLRDLFDLYGATRWQKLRLLLAPSALPHFLAGLRISANLSLVGAVVAEFVIGAQVDSPGLATTILNSQLKSDAPMMFAALALLSLTGAAIFFGINAVGQFLLRGWHESALIRES